MVQDICYSVFDMLIIKASYLCSRLVKAIIVKGLRRETVKDIMYDIDIITDFTLEPIHILMIKP